MTQNQTYTGEAKEIMVARSYKSAVINLAEENGVKPIDLTREKLRELGVTSANIGLAINAVLEIITEYYGIRLWELQSGENIKDKYGLSDEHYQMLIDEGNPTNAYAKYAQQYTGEGDNADKLRKEVHIPETQVNADVKGYKKILKKFRNNEKDNLKRMIEVESDPKKKELYEVQLRALELNDEIDG